MKIALLGYGTMGQAVERAALARGHEIVLKKSSANTYDGLENADVAIDFSTPASAVVNITTALNTAIPVISGTTGWLDDYEIIVKQCQQMGGAFLHASNFSLGVNLFFELNAHLAALMAGFPEYRIRMQEIHHTKKLDAPSGTAITLAKGIIDKSDYSSWALKSTRPDEIPIESVRRDDVPGTHSIYYESAVDSIEITHTAFNREGFALGAVIAAEWIRGKSGVFSMKDVLGLQG